jgi:GNAT superfamily N-acetyltransferase
MSDDGESEPTVLYRNIAAPGQRISLVVAGKEVGRVRVYFHDNDLHPTPAAFIEDLFVDTSTRGKGYAKRLMALAIGEAKRNGCYKMVADSRKERKNVHKLYLSLGFKKHGYSFRLDFSK